jgi:hypothetical protein
MNKKITSSALAALMIAGSTSFSALAAMANGTVVIGTKAFDMAYANDPKNADEIGNAIVAGGAVYVKDFEGNWINNTSGLKVEASVIPAVTYKNATGVVTEFAAADKDAMVGAVAVSAIDAKTFKVVFNSAPTDISKVTFTVLRGTTPVVVTPTWNATKTEATLVNSSNFPTGSYTVNVKNDTTDLGTSTIVVSQQKIAKISITSSKLGVVNKTDSQIGYATYTVIDQYGVDITSTSLANNVVFQCGAGTPTWKNGLIQLKASTGLNLLTLTSVVITGYDSSTGISTTATLATTTQVGTLSDIQVGTALTNVDNKVLTSEDTTSVFYLPYTALDVSGNPTTNYELVKSGLILTNGNELTTSANSYIKATLEQDSSNSSKAVIKVVATSATVSLDMPVVITAMTWTGKTSSISLTLKKAASLETFTIGSPAYDIATGENKEIPFTAVDQNGKAITKYSALKDNVTLNNAYLFENIDGTATLKVGPSTGAGFANEGQQIVTAMTKTGKYSSLTLNIQKPVKADSLTVDPTVLINAMEVGSTQSIDFGAVYGGFTVKDQYGRKIDMLASPGNYEVRTATQGSIEATGNAAGAVATKITASNAKGTGVVTFNLVDKNSPSVIIDSKTVTFSVVELSEIKGYTMDEVTDLIYTSTSSSAITVETERMGAYEANPYVYGTTASGSKIILKGSPIIGAYVDNSDFIVDGVPTSTVPGTYDSVSVAAKRFVDVTKTGSSATLTVAIRDTDGAVHSARTVIKSSTVAPEAKTMALSVSSTTAGLSVNGDTVTVQAVNGANLIVGKSIASFDLAGSNDNRSKVYLYAKDQYASKAIKLATFEVVSTGYTGTDKTGSKFAVDTNGTITSAGGSGTYAVITGITSNGLMKTFKIVFN